MFNNTWLFIYPLPRKVVFDNGSEFKQYFNPMLMDFDIKPVSNPVNIPQTNDPVYRLHQLIINVLFTNDIDNKVFDYIYPWSEN